MGILYHVFLHTLLLKVTYKAKLSTTALADFAVEFGDNSQKFFDVSLPLEKLDYLSEAGYHLRLQPNSLDSAH